MQKNKNDKQNSKEKWENEVQKDLASPKAKEFKLIF